MEETCNPDDKYLTLDFKQSLNDFSKDLEKDDRFKINNILCLGSGYVGVLTMSILANYFKGVKINIFDKYQTILDKWNNAGNALKQISNNNSNLPIEITNYANSEGNSINKNANSKNKINLPIIENNFQKYFLNAYERNLFFSYTLKEDEIANSDLIFICVNTPSSKEPKITDNFDVNSISSLISRGIQLSLENVFSSLEFICDSILKTNNVQLIFRKRILIQKSTVQIETLRLIREFIVNFFRKNILFLNKIIADECLSINDANDAYKESYNYNEKIFMKFASEEDVEKFVDEYFLLVNIPEFLAEGSAIENLINPDRIIIGSIKDNKNSSCAAKAMKQLYSKWIPEDKIILVDSNTSELSKLVSNAFLGQRISSINSISALCETTNSDINKLTVTIGSDSRIGKNFLKASMGFGGSCLKKDILSLVYILSSRNLDLEAQYWANVIIMNEYQRLRVCNLILKCFEKLKNKRESEDVKIDNLNLGKKEENIKPIRQNKFAFGDVEKETNRDIKVNVFGLSFKGNTNDVRGANSVFLVNFLIKNNIKVNLYDPHVKRIDFENELKIYNQDLQDEVLKEYLSFYTEESFYKEYLNTLRLSAISVFCNDHKEFKNIEFNTEISTNSKNIKEDNVNENYEDANNNNNYYISCEDKFIFDLYDVFSLEKLKEMNNFKIYKLGVVDETNNI